ncbi:hypothetical protein DFH09DRAFT_1307910 [Mycena vulgaris]|nr:hypothetical protein DFH09DRAFT_1307910 [Mycena vulgaris]
MSGMGGIWYTQEEIDELSGTIDFRYVNWLGEITIPIINSHRLIALLGGKPKDLMGWKIVTDAAAALMARLMRSGSRRSSSIINVLKSPIQPFLEGFLMVAAKCNLLVVLTNSWLHHVYEAVLSPLDLLILSPGLFKTFSPMLFAFYFSQMALLAKWGPNLQWPFLGSVFAACTFNFGPHVITVPHLDFGNLSWGWCTITALGNFDPDWGGHLILWDLKLIIWFPPRSTILFPSAIIRHSNILVAHHEE